MPKEQEDLRIEKVERIPYKIHESEWRHKFFTAYLSSIVVISTSAFLIYTIISSEEADLRGWATNLLSVIVGLAASSLWKKPS
jgi:ABC-type uncharacterized transport system permease subunit